MAVTIIPFNPGEPYLPFTNTLKNVGQYNANEAQAIENQFAPERLRLANALKQNELNFAPRKSEADIGYTEAQIPYTNAMTGKIGQETKLMPLDYLLRAQNAQQQASRFGGAYQMAKALQEMSPAARATWIAQNQDEYSQMLTELGNKQSQQNLVTPQVLNKFIPGIMPGTTEVPPGAIPQGVQPLPQSAGQQQRLQHATGGTPLTVDPMQVAQAAPPGVFKASTPEQIAQQKLASQMAANQYLTTAATRRQMEGAQQVQSIINDPEMNQRAVNASLYAGALGKGKAALDALSQKNPKAYEDYLTFKNDDMVFLNNRIKTLDQMGGTDKQREELHGLYEKAMDSLSSNPAQFMTQFNNLKKSLDNIARGVQKSATPLFPVNRLQGQQSGAPLPAPKIKSYNPATGKIE